MQANASSGMRVSDECKTKFGDLKKKKTYRFIIFKIDEKVQEITVEKVGGPDESYDTFSSALPESEPRYGVFDFDFVTEDNCQKSKIFFIAW
jgi:cofilin